MERIFIDKFTIPESAKGEFIARMTINRDFIATLPGFIEDTVYESIDEHGNFLCITIAVWESEDALNKAKEAVQTEYKKQGFNPAEMLERLHIAMDRGVYWKAMR